MGSGHNIDILSRQCYIKNMKKFNFKNILWKEGKYYVAQCLNVEVSSFGKTKKEAIANLTEALELYCEDLKTINIPKIEEPQLISTSLCYA